jgi:hypothetical protein
MRTSLFAPTLFTVSLIGGVALADKPHVMDQLRARGDIVDKVYAAPRVVSEAASFGAPGVQAGAARNSRPSFDKAASRVNCADVDVSCASSSSASHGASTSSKAHVEHAAISGARRPASLDKVLGSDRTNFNEAGEDQGMSLHAAQRAWSHGSSSSGGDAGGAASKSIGDRQAAAHETGDSGSSGRMSCNEADECTMSNKDTRKIWAKASADAGTLAGVEKARAAAAADARFAAARRAESEANAHGAAGAREGGAAGHAHGAAGAADEH